MKTAKYWHKRENRHVECDLCPHGCNLAEGKTGLCRVRVAKEGELKAAAYGCVSSAGMDPIEKKPLYHFCPGTMIFSFGGWGCNLACEFCQNWTISQKVESSGPRYEPRHIVDKALTADSIGIAYTYNEPLINIEYVEDCARLAKAEGLANVLVTNGYVQAEAAGDLLPLVDALNIDIKSMDDGFYRKICHGNLKPVLDFAVQAARAGCHVEITNLIIPSLNDEDYMVSALAKWIRENLGAATPLHLSAYHPQYKVRIPPTPLEVLRHAYDICSADLTYVYLGNVWTDVGQDTRCPACANVLVSRRGYETKVGGIVNGCCRNCGRKCDMVIR
jgi:pyruvate formate lyase activating enzyme